MRCFSAPGRVEIGGNHTDHQHGRVLAAAIGLEITATIGIQGGGSLVLLREHKRAVPLCSIDLNDFDVRADEVGTSAALVRGVAAWFVNFGYAIGGFG